MDPLPRALLRQPRRPGQSGLVGLVTEVLRVGSPTTNTGDETVSERRRAGSLGGPRVAGGPWGPRNRSTLYHRRYSAVRVTRVPQSTPSRAGCVSAGPLVQASSATWTGPLACLSTYGRLGVCRLVNNTYGGVQVQPVRTCTAPSVQLPSLLMMGRGSVTAWG